MKPCLTKYPSYFLLVLALSAILLSCKKQDDDGGLPDNDHPGVLYYEAEYQHYTSTTFDNSSRPLVICLPSDYDTITVKLPVLYLFHGYGGSESSWIVDGHITGKLSAAYEAGVIGPMIVVMPLCEPQGSNFSGVGPDGDAFVREMVVDIIPYIESHYHVSTERRHRAVGGLSAGGMQTLNLALFYPELFDYVYPMSTGYMDAARTEIETGVYDAMLNNPEINNIKKFTFSIGKQDFLFYGSHFQATLDLLDTYGIQYDYWEADGGHDWIFWQLSLDTLLPEIFREEE
jgi:enterochelin esterase-like enzyme